MFEIVTLAETKAFLRVEHDDEDDVIGTLIGAAVEAALRLADGYDPAETPVPMTIKLAVLVHVARAYDNRQDAADTPPSAARLIYPHRVMDL